MQTRLNKITFQKMLAAENNYQNELATIAKTSTRSVLMGKSLFQPCAPCKAIKDPDTTPEIKTTKAFKSPPCR